MAGQDGFNPGEGSALFGGSGSAGSPQHAGSWSIGLMVFSGPDRAARAVQAADGVRTQHRALRDAFVEERGDRAVVLVGRQSSPSSREAVAALDRIRALRIGDGQPFVNAFYVPPTEGRPGDLDLRSARTVYRGLYSLQVGVYGRADTRPPTEKELSEFREAAEEAARELRARGELAFYSHGPTLSMVTVGTFSEADLEPGAVAVARLRERFPNNLLNGRGVRQRVMTESGQEWVLQPSFLVSVPE
ncbi:MAG: hypothetical protein AAGB48_05790 [Planctomycetota bacterium]